MAEVIEARARLVSFVHQLMPTKTLDHERAQQFEKLLNAVFNTEKISDLIRAHTPEVTTSDCEFGDHISVYCSCGKYDFKDDYNQMPEWQTHLIEELEKEL